jgi:hypothetical protein
VSQWRECHRHDLHRSRHVVVHGAMQAALVAVLDALQLDGSKKSGEFLAVNRSYGNLDDQGE